MQKSQNTFLHCPVKQHSNQHYLFTLKLKIAMFMIEAIVKKNLNLIKTKSKWSEKASYARETIAACHLLYPYIIHGKIHKFNNIYNTFVYIYIF